MMFLYTCKQVYNPSLKGVSTNYLVVDGMINTGTDSTFIKLNRTVLLNSKVGTKVETKAKLSIESDANATTYALKEIKGGTYAVAPLNLNKTAKYRLRIITNDGTTYVSDFVEVKEAPPIDKVGLALPATGAQILVNAHDANNKTHYYRYEFVETWMVITKYTSNFAPNTTKTDIIPRDQATQNISTCWRTAYSTDIGLASSAKLTQDVLADAPVSLIPAASQKLRYGYDVLVKQYALTEDAFNFWQLVKKNTEQLGSIFDAQPSEIKGNIHNVSDNKEPVFGFISAGTFQEKRLHIDRTMIPVEWGTENFYGSCPIGDELPLVPKSSYLPFYQGSTVPIIEVFSPTGTFLGYTGATRECGDCTLIGNPKKPSFWP
jgi:hypothetical protein